MTFAYDDRGNITRYDATSYLYTTENRLAESPSETVRLRYDPLGRLSQLARGAPASAVVTNFDHIGGTMISEYNSQLC